MPIALAQHLSASRVNNAVLISLSPESMLTAWLTAHPKVANAMYYDGKHYHGTWPTWPDALKQDLAERWAAMVAWYGNNMPSPDPASFTDPIPKVQGDPSQNYDGFMMPAERGRHMYLSHVANGLALEMTGRLPWTITTYSQKHLEDLFTAQYWFVYLTPPDATIEGFYFEEPMSPATPAHVMRFLVANNLLGTSALDTVARLVGWCRILTHYFETNTNPNDPHLFWGPDAPPIPCEMLMNGSNYTGYTPPQFARYTMGCGGTTAFFKSLLRAVNIPVEEQTPPCGHAMPLFPTIKRALSHGDDPYNSFGKVTPYPGWPVPASDALLITEDQFNQWFDPALDPGVMINNVGRRPAEIAVEYQSDQLLFYYCEDTAAGRDHASGKVYEELQNYYTLAQLESMSLWDKLAAKAAATDTCGTPAALRPVFPSQAHPRVRVEPQVRRRPRKV
jgi:hypothetical protein